MPDIYETLMGEAPNSERVAEIAAALRRRRSYGELGALTGDKVLAPVGRKMSDSADDTAAAIQKIRQQDVDNAQTRTYQQGQLGHMGKSLEETMRANKARDATSRRGQDFVLEAARLRAQAAAQKAAMPKQNKLTYADRKKLEEFSNLLHGSDDLARNFKDDYTQKAGPGPQSRLVNTAAAYGIGTQGTKEAADWWAGWNMIYTLPQRNATFGATLTPTERQSWAGSDINPAMDAKQIRSRVDEVTKILKRKAGLADKTYRAQGFDSNAMDAYELADREEGELTEEEAAELAELEKEFGGR
jgi:hypothetical protein